MWGKFSGLGPEVLLHCPSVSSTECSVRMLFGTYLSIAPYQNLGQSWPLSLQIRKVKRGFIGPVSGD